MDQDPRATACPNNWGTKETSPCAQSSQASISPRPAKRRKLTEEDSAEQIAAGRISPQQCSEEELRLPLQPPTQVMPNTSDYQEWMGQREGPGEDTVEQSRRDGQEDDAFSSLPRKADLFRASLLIFPEIKTTQAQYDGLIEEAVKHGQSNAAHAANPAPRLIMGGGKWQSTLVTLKVEGVAGASCQYFNSDLWRYGGRVSLLHNPNWHELDSIDLKICHERIKVSLHEAWARHSTTWSWSSDENGVFRVHPEHIHVVEMVCGYLNLAAGREVKGTVGGLFDLPHGSSRMSRCGLARYLSRSFVCFLGDVGQLDPDKTKTAGKIDPADVVDALTRVHGEPMQMLESSRRPPKDTKKSAGSDTVSIEETPVRLPSIWGACGDRPCVCGDPVMVVDTTQDQLEVRELAFGEKYLAISYVWAQHDQPHLLSYIRRAIEVTAVHSVWVDQLCINQRCDQHKARQIPRMREVYQKGYATVALVPDITEIVPTIFHAPTATVPQHRLSVAARFISQMKCCVWRTRCWTWQEGLLGGRGYYVTQKQVLPARIVSDFLVLSYGDKREVGIGSGLMDSLGSRSLRCQIDTWSQQISLGDLLDAEKVY